MVTDLSKNGTSQYKTFENEEDSESKNSKDAAKTFSKDGKLLFYNFFLFSDFFLVTPWERGAGSGD